MTDDKTLARAIAHQEETQRRYEKDMAALDRETLMDKLDAFASGGTPEQARCAALFRKKMADEVVPTVVLKSAVQFLSEMTT